MKALIIENEHAVDNSIKAFLKDNPDLFESVNEQTFCETRSVRDVGRFIPDVDAIIIATTWMYKDQVVDYIDAFLTGVFKDKPMSFYIHRFIRTANEWKEGWSDAKELRSKIIELLKSGRKLYSFDEIGDKRIVDKLNLFYKEYDRYDYKVHEILYSDEHDLFYMAHEYYNLLSVIEDEEDLLKRKIKN